MRTRWGKLYISFPNITIYKAISSYYSHDFSATKSVVLGQPSIDLARTSVFTLEVPICNSCVFVLLTLLIENNLYQYMFLKKQSHSHLDRKGEVG